MLEWLQVECDPYFGVEKLGEFCKQKDILLLIYCPLFSHSDYFDSSHASRLLKKSIINALAQKYKKTEIQILFKYLVSVRSIACVAASGVSYQVNVINIVCDFCFSSFKIQCRVIPLLKTNNLDNLRTNFDIWDFTMDPEDCEEIHISMRRTNPGCILFSQ